MKNRNFISAVTASLLFVACGGGSSDAPTSVVNDTSAVNGVSSKIGTGYYVDAAVFGVNYACGTEEGVTDIRGKFIFEKGENCTFKLGDLVLRELNASSLEDNVTIFEDNVEVARLLQTMDSDGNASNGIEILPEVHEVITEKKITKVPKNISELTELQEAVKQKNPEKYEGAVVSNAEAKEHLEVTRQTLVEENRRTQIEVEQELESRQEMPNSISQTRPENPNNSENNLSQTRPAMLNNNEDNLTQIRPEIPNSNEHTFRENLIQNLPMFRSINSDVAQKNIAANEILIKFKEGMEDSIAFREELKKYLTDDEHILESFKAIGTGHIEADTKSVEELKAILEKPEFAAYVESVSENYIMHLAVTNDSNYADLWAIENNGQTVNSVTGTVDADMDVVEAWEKTTGSKEVIVAVLDTGVDYTHSDLADNMWQGNVNHGYDFAADNEGGDDDNPMPDLPYADNGHYHGTHVAGIIGAVANNNNGIAGVAQNVSIMALKVFRPDGTGYTSDILEALNYVSQKIDEGENIVAINASFAGGGSQTDTINEVIKELGAKGVIFCAAAGNESSDNDQLPVFPASYDASNIIAIGASDADDNLATFSNYGASSVDVVAPGTNILSTYPDNEYAYLQGTSMATPNVAGTVALLATYYPDATVDELKAMVVNNVDVKTALNGKVLSNGRVNTNEALGSIDTPPSNVAPITINDEYITEYMTAKNLDVLSNDSDADEDELSIVSFTQGTNGTVAQDNNELVYAPNDGFSGEDIFTYTITDDELNSTATVTMTVNEEEQVNTAPLANDDNVLTAYETLIKFDVLVNDSDEQNDTLSITNFTATLNGTLVLDAGAFTYVPNNSFSGEDGFEYTLSDGLLTSTAKVQVVVAEEVIDNNGTDSGDNNETVPENPDMGDHNGTRPEMPDMGDFNRTRPEMPNMAFKILM